MSKNLLNLSVDFWQYMAIHFIYPHTLLQISFTCRSLRSIIDDKLNDRVWKRWCFEKFLDINPELEDTFIKYCSQIPLNSCFKRAFYLQKSAVLLECKLMNMQKRVYESQNDRNYNNFLDFFLILKSDDALHFIHYKQQMLKLNLVKSKRVQQDLLLLKFEPTSSDTVFRFKGLENNYTQAFLRIVSRRPNEKNITTTKTKDILIRPFFKETLLGIKDREILGDFFKNDKSYYKQSSGRTINTDHARARNQHYYGKNDEDRLLRESTLNLQPLSCNKILWADYSIDIDDFYDDELNLFRGVNSP